MSIVEVAKLAGVSNSTVSRVINNHPRVGIEAIKAVRAAMEQLQYAPPARRPGPKLGARAVPRRTTLALLVFGSGIHQTPPGFDELMRGISTAVGEAGVKLLYHDMVDPTVLPLEITEGRFDGLLLCGASPAGSARDLLAEHPTVWLMSNRRRPDWGDQVMPDTYEIGTKAASYLAGRGHKHLTFLNLERGHWPFRLAGESFTLAAEEHGAKCDRLEVQRDEDTSDWTAYAAKAADRLVQRFLELTPRPTGLFVAEDMQVAVIHPALQRARVALGPGQVEIISCNNEQSYLIGLTPKPAEVDLNAEAIGYRGVERLLWRLNNQSTPGRIVTVIEPRVVDHDGKTIDSFTL